MREGTALERAAARPRRVLIAEDDDDLRNVLARVVDAEPDLQCVGSVAVPEQIEEAIARLWPDVLVLDLVLEGGTSLHLIGRLHSTHPALRIVLHSGYVGSVVLTEVRKRGASACIAKGDDYERLLDAVRGFLPPVDVESADPRPDATH
jgi:DNA-binding NarL/FixJ family response regulator